MNRESFLSSLVVQPNGCMWISDLFLFPTGYQLVYFEGLKTYIHRAAVMAHGVEIPAGWEVDHLCHSNDPTCPGGSDCLHRRCGNIDHLEVVTRQENARRIRQRHDAKWGEECRVAECSKPRASLGLCSLHYQRLRARGTIDAPPLPAPRPNCSVDDCERPYVALGMCDYHYRIERRIVRV